MSDDNKCDCKDIWCQKHELDHQSMCGCFKKLGYHWDCECGCHEKPDPTAKAWEIVLDIDDDPYETQVNKMAAALEAEFKRGREYGYETHLKALKAHGENERKAGREETEKLYLNTMDQHNKSLELNMKQARQAALEEAAKFIKDGHGSPKCVDPEDCPYCCFAERIRGLK
jgi:hypothetical protein